MTAADLCAVIALLFAEVPAERACAQAPAILEAADDTFGPELLAAIAVRESKLQPDALNPRSAACSTMQVLVYPARDRRRACAAMRADLTGLAGYRAGVERLHAWRLVCLRRGTPGLRCVLRGYNGGARGVAGVIWRRDQIRRALARMQPPVVRQGAGS